MITSSLSNNITLKLLRFYNDNSIIDKDVPFICHFIIDYTTLKWLHFICPNISKFDEQQISNILDNNNTLINLLINGNTLC